MNFSLKNVDGKMVSLEDYADTKGVIVIFTCNHCPYAIAYENRIKELHRTFEPQGIGLIAISSNDPKQYPQDSFENMKVRAESKGFTFPYLFDETQEVAKAYEATRTPHAYFLVGKEAGWEITYKGAIDDNYKSPDQVTERYLADHIESFLNRGPVKFRETPAVGCTIKWRH